MPQKSSIVPWFEKDRFPTPWGGDQEYLPISSIQRSIDNTLEGHQQIRWIAAYYLGFLAAITC